jgi:hypothetical protein
MHYIIVGADKCGTDALRYHLNLHEEIYCDSTERHFFSQNKNYNIGIKKYEEIFNFENKPIYGEKSPSYMFLKIAIDRIYENYPDVKIIISLREPVSRVYSSHNHQRNNGNINVPFIQLIHQNENNNNQLEDLTNTYLNQYRNCVSEFTLQRGYYINYIEYIYSTFPNENIYIGINEEFLKNPLEEYNKLFKFLGAKELSHETFSLIYTTNINKGKYKERITYEDFKYVYNLYKDYNERLYTVLGKRIESWDNIYMQRGLM